MIHQHGYWLEISGDNKHVCDMELSNAIVDLFKIQTVVDIGCGDGRYVFNFLAHGIKCDGYDGSPLTPGFTRHLCHIEDFACPVHIGNYDLVLSLEVGEHIPEEFEQVFIDNLCRASKKYICLSWGIPGQPGYGHINCQTNEYIISELKRRGFNYHNLWTLHLRDKSTFPWFKNTLMVFEK